VLELKTGENTVRDIVVILLAGAICIDIETLHFRDGRIRRCGARSAQPLRPGEDAINNIQADTKFIGPDYARSYTVHC